MLNFATSVVSIQGCFDFSFSFLCTVEYESHCTPFNTQWQDVRKWKLKSVAVAMLSFSGTHCAWGMYFQNSFVKGSIQTAGSYSCGGYQSVMPEHPF